MIAFDEEMSAAEAKFEKEIEEFQGSTKEIREWLKEALHCSKSGDKEGLKTAVAMVWYENTQLYAKGFFE